MSSHPLTDPEPAVAVVTGPEGSPAGPSDTFKLLGDRTRWGILEFLARPIRSSCSRADGVCGCDLEEFLGVTQATISHHMKHLVGAGLVRSERRGRWVYYVLEAEAFRQLAGALTDLASAADDANEAARE